MDVAGEHALSEELLVLLGPVGGVGLHARAGVVLLTTSGSRAPSWALAALASQVRRDHERGIEASEQPVDRLDLPLAEQPQRRCVRHRAVEPEP